MNILDTSVVSAAFNQSDARHTQAVGYRDGIGKGSGTPCISVITLSEIQFGLEVMPMRASPPSQAAIDQVKQRLASAQKLLILQVTKHVAKTHGELRAKWAAHIAPKRLAQGKLKGIPPELWSDSYPASILQITENDLWIAATAITHAAKLVTVDGDFDRLKVVDSRLDVERI